MARLTSTVGATIRCRHRLGDTIQALMVAHGLTAAQVEAACAGMTGCACAPPHAPAIPRWRPIRREHKWRVWTAYHTEMTLASIPEYERAALHCPSQAPQVERNTALPGPTGRRFGGGPYLLTCPCGIPSRWFYSQARTHPETARRWLVQPWPGDEVGE